MPIRGRNQEHWIAGAHNPKHKGKLRDLVRRRYGAAGFTKSPKTGRQIIRHNVLDKLTHDSDKHVRGMAAFTLNAQERHK